MEPLNDKLIKTETKSFFARSPISKYSNLTLFNRREKELSDINNKARKFSAPKLVNFRHLLRRKLIEKKNKKNSNTQINPPFLSINIHNISNIFPLVQYYNDFITNSKKIKNKSKNNTYITNNKNIYGTLNTTRSNSFFSTSINKFNNNNKNKTPKNFYKKEKIFIDSKNYGNSLDARLLNTFEEEKKLNSKLKIEEYKSKLKKNIHLLESKDHFLYKDNKRSHNSYIKKTMKYKLIEYATNIKKERAVRLQETDQNNIEYYQDAINSLEEAEKLFNSKFLNRMADYTRFVSSRKEIEKVKLSKTIQQIFRLKIDIEHILTKIKKVESEKYNIIRWIYFQIQLTEKKLVLPNYYKTIIEESSDKSKYNRRASRKDEKDSKDNKKEANSFLIKKDPSKRRDSRKYGFNDFFPSSRNSINNQNINSNFAYKTARDETETIRKYRTNLAIKNADELKEKLELYANDNIILMEKNDMLYRQLFYLTKKLNNDTKIKNEIENLNKNQIQIKEKELEEIKSNYKNKKRIISSLKVKNKEVGNDKNILLYKAVKKTYSTCRIMDKNEIKIDKLQKPNTWREEILNMLEYSEIFVDNLLDKFKIYNNDNMEMLELIRKLSYNIDKKHKNDKAIKQKMKELEKSKELRKKFEERNNKIIFLPKKKLDISKFHIKKEKNTKNKKINKIPTFEDYLFHDDYENNSKNDK